MNPKLTKEQQKIYSTIMAEKDEIEAPCSLRLYRTFKRIASNPDNYFTVGFGGGSVPGIAGNCALAALLEELEIRPFVKEVWGTSAGAVVGGGWSSGTQAARIRDITAGIQQKGGADFSWWDIVVKGLLRFLFFKQLPDGLVRGRNFQEAIIEGLEVKTFEECEIPFRAITCTDDGYARKIILREGPLVDAISASMCLPGVFYPVAAKDGTSNGYFDGAVVEKTPLISIIEEHKRMARDCQLVILCTHFSSSARIRKPVGFMQRSVSTMNHLEQQVWQYQLTKARQVENCKFIVLNPHMKIAGMLDFTLVYFNYLWARKMFKEQLSNAGLGKRFDAL